MIGPWMLYSLLVSALVAVAAWVLEEVCRLTGRPVRWVWLGALGVTLALVALAPLRGAPPRTVVFPARVVDGGAAPAARESSGVLAALADAASAVRQLADDALAAAVKGAERVPEEVLAGGWLALSAALLAVAAGTLLRARAERRRWPLHEMEGTPVRVAPRVGPAVLGVRAPEVVVPRWLLEAPPEEQRLVVLHEREHIRARDPLLLAAGCMAAALVPWNPAAWWMLLRLRTAVELDCDARVLRHGVRPLAYGTLLIDMAGRGPGLTLGAPAMAGSPSSLERRLRAMNVRLPRFAPARAGLLGVLASAALVGACQADLPTNAEVDRMDVAAVEAQFSRMRIIDDGDLTYLVDGKPMTAQEARAITSDRIAQVQVRRTPDGKGTVEITTGTPGSGTRFLRTEDLAIRRAPGDTGSVRVFVRTAEGGAGAPIRISPLNQGDAFSGLIVIDGQIVDQSALRSISPARIEKMEVVKGAAAAAQYPNDPRAAQGVIRITTKP